MLNEFFILVISFILNALLGVVMFFMKQSNDAMKERVSVLETDYKKMNDTVFKKEDFREFKDELWVRMDKMEVAFEKRLTNLSRENR